MIDYSDYKVMTEELSDTQSDEQYRREHSQEAHEFLEKRDGMWDPDVFRKMSGRPRLTYDKTTPIRNQIAGEMEQADFSIKVKPAGGDATKELAKLRDGMIRNILNISNGNEIFNHASRSNVTAGIDGCRVVTEFVESDSFDKDLLIVPVANFLNRVWFDRTSEKQDRSDADFQWDIQSIPIHEYKERWPDGAGTSVSTVQIRSDRNLDDVIVGEFLYKKPVDIEIVQMSDGKVYLADKFEPVKDELEAQGITEVDRRTREGHIVYSRMFDGSDWLEEEKETIFEWLPIVPIYGNFRIDEDNLPVYFGVIEKLMDPQRAVNYYGSRDLEEIALAPRPKYWLTQKQALNHQSTLATMNTNQDPYQLYNHVEGHAYPQQQGGALVNQGLQVGLGNASNALQEASGLPPANMGANPLMQSGAAIELQQSKGDTGTIHWFRAAEIFRCHVARILVNALPKHYDNKRATRVLGEDGSFEMVNLNEEIFDQEQGKMVVLNDLSIGQYDVTCDSGPSFKNRQEETAKALVQLSDIIPGVAELGADVLLNNISAPGVSIIAERVRARMVQGGGIPDDQLTDDEKALVEQQRAAAAQQPQEQTPDDKAAEALKLEAEVKAQDLQIKAALAESKIQDTEIRREIDIATAQGKAEDADAKLAMDAKKIEQQEDMNMLKLMQQRAAQEDARFNQQLEVNAALLNELKVNAEVLKTIREAMGVDSIVGPHNTEAYIQQAEMITDTQEEIAPGLETAGIATNDQRV